MWSAGHNLVSVGQDRGGLCVHTDCRRHPDHGGRIAHTMRACHTERCMFSWQNEAKNKIILFLCFMSFLFYFSEKERILQNHTRPPRLPLRHVWIGMGVVGSSPLAKRKGGVRIPRALWVEDLPAALSVSVLGFCQNNVSVQKYFCIFHLTTLLAFV